MDSKFAFFEIANSKFILEYDTGDPSNMQQASVRRLSYDGKISYDHTKPRSAESSRAGNLTIDDKPPKGGYVVWSYWRQFMGLGGYGQISLADQILQCGTIRCVGPKSATIQLLLPLPGATARLRCRWILEGAVPWRIKSIVNEARDEAPNSSWRITKKWTIDEYREQGLIWYPSRASGSTNDKLEKPSSNMSFVMTRFELNPPESQAKYMPNLEDGTTVVDRRGGGKTWIHGKGPSKRMLAVIEKEAKESREYLKNVQSLPDQPAGRSDRSTTKVISILCLFIGAGLLALAIRKRYST